MNSDRCVLNAHFYFVYIGNSDIGQFNSNIEICNDFGIAEIRAERTTMQNTKDRVV